MKFTKINADFASRKLLCLVLFLVSLSSNADAKEYLYSNGMYVFLTGDRLASSSEDDGVASVAVVIDGEVLQFDVGMRSIEHLITSGVSPARINYVFFTHLHIDHIMGFPNYFFFKRTWRKKEDVKVFGPHGTKEMIDGAKKFMATHIRARPAFAEKIGFDMSEFKEGVLYEEITNSGVILETENFKVTAMSVPHEVESYSYRVDSKYGSVVISGDTAPSLNMVELATDVDLLIHEATLKEKSDGKYASMYATLADGLRSTTPKDKIGHTGPAELGKIAQKAKVKKLVAYHLGHILHSPDPVELGDLDIAKNQSIAAIKQYYDGPLIMAEPLMVFEIGQD